MKKILITMTISLLVLSTMTTAFASEYLVKEGDVLWKIAKHNNTTVEALVKANQIKNKHLIYVNQLIHIPEGEVMTMTNTQKAVAVIESLGTTNTEPVGYINPSKYIQHNLAVADGLEGFGALVAVLPEGTYGKNIRVFEDGEYVIMQNEYDFFGPTVGFDIFRFEDGKIVEHWDNLSPLSTEPNPSGRTQLDGTKTITDLDQTEANKSLVKNMLRDVFMGAAPEKITDYISTDQYLQHNTAIADGLDGLGAALAALAEAGTPMIYTENHFVFGQGNFVLAASEGEFLGNHVAFYDLFRLEKGKVVEHWDTVQDIPEKADWKNTNGKF